MIALRAEIYWHYTSLRLIKATRTQNLALTQKRKPQMPNLTKLYKHIHSLQFDFEIMFDILLLKSKIIISGKNFLYLNVFLYDS